MMDYIAAGIAIIVSCILVKDAYFSAICLRQAVKWKKLGVTKYNYLRWEMPDNDIEHQIEDEIQINTLFLTGIAIWLVSLLFYPNSMLVVYVPYAVIAFLHSSKELEKRYSDFYELFRTKKRREDFSDELVDYGLRIEGTITKLKKSRVCSIAYVVWGMVLFLC